MKNLNKSKWIKVSKREYYPKNHNITQLNNKDLNLLKKNISKNNATGSRICIHTSIKDKIQQMILFHPKGSYIRPHKSASNEESYMILNGEMDVILFDNIGKIKRKIELGDLKSKKIFFFRMKKSLFRTMIIKKDTIFLEVKKGPFVKNKSTIYADWSPKKNDRKKLKTFFLKIRNFK
tara:strand:- start:1226 stop:1759 length:534 start_codon:yes stop_codon:yes gene_type:complete